MRIPKTAIVFQVKNDHDLAPVFTGGLVEFVGYDEVLPSHIRAQPCGIADGSARSGGGVTQDGWYFDIKNLRPMTLTARQVAKGLRK